MKGYTKDITSHMLSAIVIVIVGIIIGKCIHGSSDEAVSEFKNVNSYETGFSVTESPLTDIPVSITPQIDISDEDNGEEENIVGDNEEIKERNLFYSKMYKDEVTGNLDSIYENEGYYAVMAVLQDAKNTLGQDNDLTELYNLWSGRGKSTIVTNDLRFGQSYNVQISESYPLYSCDRYKNKYTNIIYPDYCENAEVELYLNKEYGKFVGTVYVTSDAVDSVSSGSSRWDNITIVFYGDDRKLAEFSGYDYKSKPESLSVDVRGVEFLRISFVDACFTEYGGWKPMVSIGESTLCW